MKECSKSVNRVQSLLKSLEPVLNSSGEVRSAEDMVRVVGLMKDMTKLESRCTYLNIVLKTSDCDVLYKFVSAGGWTIMNEWLEEVKQESTSEDSLFLEEVLRALIHLPVTVDTLKQNSTPKLIKNLSKDEDFTEDVRKLASEVVKIWMNVIKGKSANSDSQDVKSDANSKESVGKEKKKKKEKECRSRKMHAPPSTGHRKTGLEEAESPQLAVNNSQPKPKKRPSLESDAQQNIKKPKTDVKPESKLDSKPKSTVTLSTDFADALFKPAAPVAPIKKKHIAKHPKPTIPKEVAAKKSKTEKSDSDEKPTVEDDSQPSDVSEVDVKKDSPTDSPSQSSDDSGVKRSRFNSSGEPNGILVYHKPYRKNKKSIQWAPEDQLLEIEYFEVDESERVNVTKQEGGAFHDFAKMDSHREKQLMLQMKNMNVEPLNLVLIDIPNRVDVKIGISSTEKALQANREASVLAEIYFDVNCIPDTPTEPEPESVEKKDPIEIPLDDITIVNDPPPAIKSPVVTSPQQLVFPQPIDINKQELPPVQMISQQPPPPPVHNVPINPQMPFPPPNQILPPQLRMQFGMRAPPPPLIMERPRQPMEMQPRMPPRLERPPMQMGIRDPDDRRMFHHKNQHSNKRTVCRFWKKNDCKKGDACHFLHQ